MSTETYARFVERYGAQEIPWDSELPPPEVLETVAAHPPGRALDLGCGYGRASIYLAQQGWQVDGIDFVPAAIAEAKKRAKTAALSTHIRFHTASVTDLSFLDGDYQFALDVGCLHALTPVQLVAYHAELCRLLAPEAIFLLFARLCDSEAEEPRGIEEALIRQQFRQGFALTRCEHGETQVEDKPPWPSGWFWFERSMTNEKDPTPGT